MIKHVVEINPAKQGKFMPGSGQNVIGPRTLREYQPDRIIITNALYEQEMRQQAHQLGVSAEFLVA